MVEERMQDVLRQVAAAGGYRLNQDELRVAKERLWANLCAGLLLPEAVWRAVYESKGRTFTHPGAY